MALDLASWAVEGATSTPQVARLMHQSGTASGNGIVDSGHLRVLPLAVPGTEVRVTSGGATILGREATFQGSYFAFNVGEVSLPISPTGSGSGRSDLVVLRVEDPNISGTPWTWDVTTEPVYYFRVLQGVDPGTTEPPPGMTAVALARIDIPAATGTITSGMVKDVRQSANPKRLRVLRVQAGGVLTGGKWDEAGNIQFPDWERYPQHDWTIDIPWWATQAQILGDWTNMMLLPNGGTGGNRDARGRLRVGLVGGPTDPLYTAPASYNFNQTSPTNGYRCSAFVRDQIPIPASWRGLTVNLRMYAAGTDGTAGRLSADSWSNFSCDVEFLERPAPEASL